MMRRILVTGKSSFIAGHFARYMEGYAADYSVELISCAAMRGKA